MSVEPGKKYVGPTGVRLVAVKPGTGILSDGDIPLVLEGQALTSVEGERTEPQIKLGKRFQSADKEVEVLVITPGVCDLRYNGEPMKLMESKVLPSAD